MKEGDVLFSTAYMPPIAYMAAMMRQTDATIEVKETYSKQTYRNRCTILTANGPLDLTIPVSRPSGNRSRTEEIIISYAEPWNVRHWRAIESAYSASPYFLYYRDGIEQLLKKRHERLVELNTSLTEHLIKTIKGQTQLKLSDDYMPAHSVANDYRNTFSPKRIIPTGCFEEYPQVFEYKYKFQANLSIIDLLFNLGPESRSYLQNIPIEKIIG